MRQKKSRFKRTWHGRLFTGFQPRSYLVVFAFLLVAAQYVAADAVKLEELVIETRNGPQNFQVEVADTDATRELGLMYRRSMPERQGMIFDFFRNERVSFWMKNTYLPLDMIFITESGKIADIHEWATPESTKAISPKVPVQAVLELIGGSVQRFGIREGDLVTHRIFSK